MVDIKTESRNAQKLHSGRAFSYQLVDAYHRRFLDKKTGKFAARYTEYRPCPTCDADQPRKIFDSSGGTYVRCLRCSMVYLNPVFTEASLRTYYENLNTGQAAITSNESDFFREIYSLGLAAIGRFGKKGSILDIGCSSGFFLDLARKKGWRTHGVELGVAEAKLCAKKGHTLYTRDVRELGLKDRFDAITLWDVFEHIPDGQKYLKFLAALLRERGVLFMQIPSAGALAARLMRAECRMFDGVEHVNLYGPDTIRRIAAKCGFRIAHLSSAISEIAVMNNFLSYEDPYFGMSVYGEKLLGVLPAHFLHQNLLGYKLQVVLRKGNR